MKGRAPSARGAPRGWVLAAALVCAAGCRPPTRAVPDASAGAKPTGEPPVVTDVSDKDYAMPPLPRARVVLTDAFGGSHTVDVEVAASHAARTRGLMWRTSLPAGQGMLFAFDSETIQRFWMRNTLIPLDMLFIDRGLTVVGIVRSAAPRDEGLRGVDRPSTYVLEVPGGWAESAGVQPGSKVRLEGWPPAAP